VIDDDPLNLVRAEGATLRQVFKHVALVGHPEPGGNHVFLVSDSPLPDLPTSSAARELDPGDGGALRDADAPADQLLTPAR
jgi:hypothetical protein